MPRIVVAAPPVVRQRADLARLPPSADVVELRMDLLDLGADVAEIRAWVEASPRPVMATLRSRAEGGAWTGSAKEAARVLERAAAAGVAYVDLEIEVARHVRELPASVEVVVSRHGRAGGAFPQVVGGRSVRHWKHALEVKTPEDLDLLREIERDVRGDARLTLVPYGALGGWRAAFAQPGALLYGAARREAAVVTGQPTLDVLLDELRAGEVGSDAALFGLLGRPPSHSPSPAMHNAVFRAQDRNALYLPLPDLELADALRLPFAGFSVTAPYKRDALARATDADPVARATGAANTLIRDATGGWFAANTDVSAIARAVPTAEASGARAFVYGAGGYARAAVVALRQQGYTVRVGARQEERGRALARSLDVAWAGEHFVRHTEDRVLLNATPAGVDGSLPPFVGDEAHLSELTVLDAPYRDDDRLTGLVAAARERGARRVVDGFALLLAQAEEQARLFAGSPEEVNARVLETAILRLPPLLLMGLRGSGKSTVGRAVAARLGRPFLDLDDEVERISGKRPGWWIRMRGEPAFRGVEADAVERISGRRGLVVAAGGGVLESPRARRVVEEQTWPLFLHVSPDLAATRAARRATDRPPLTDAVDARTEAHLLAERREPSWRKIARCVIDASCDIDAVVRRVGEAWVGSGPGPNPA